MLKNEPTKSKFAPSSYRYKEDKITLKVIISGIVILLISGILARYAQQGVDYNKSEPSVLGFIVMMMVGFTSLYTIEKVVRHYFFNNNEIV